MPAKRSQFASALAVDPALVQTNGFRQDEEDRGYQDSQHRDVQALMLSTKLNGVSATYARLASNSAAVVAGDIVITASTVPSDGIPIVTIATAAAVIATGARGIAGIVLVAAGPNARILIALAGSVLPPTVTGLAANAGACQLSTTARCERVTQVAGANIPVGTIDSAGMLTLGAVLPISLYEVVATAFDDNVVVAESIAIGPGPADAGSVRIANVLDGGAIKGRNFAGSGNLDIAHVDTNNAVVIGDGLNIYPLGSIRALLPIVGEDVGGSPTPYAAHGSISLAATDANFTEAATTYKFANIIYTGALGAGRTVTYPIISSNARSYHKSIFNNTTGGFALTFTNTGGTTVAIAAGKTAILVFEAGGVRRITADV